MLAAAPSAPILLALALLAACGGTQTLETAQGPCVEGQSARCDCDDGSVGVRLCGRDSRYGACDCPAGAGASGTTGGANPTAGTTGGAAGVAGVMIDPVGGTGGGGGFPPTGGSSGVGGGGVGGVAGVAGMTGGASGTSGGFGGSTGGFGGMTGGSPATGGSGGAAGTTGGSGGMSATGGSGGGPGNEPKPGELYGDCLASGTCKNGLLCISDGSSGIPMSYCTTTCGGVDGMRCPRSRDDQMATCVLGICVRQ